ncbi:hypothetical protein DMC30DRAFT_212633 [Rhodotorula diobovata]|uniref:Uncharacterized protein n=1 Tax=Rhodotorula diobovata TaxID=5288 RepID=A0A5C5FWJ1_9BASI|nr:hypothetical protein DMC30DRAFT_212633 [Rhodotorula diobovata]
MAHLCSDSPPRRAPAHAHELRRWISLHLASSLASLGRSTPSRSQSAHVTAGAHASPTLAVLASALQAPPSPCSSPPRALIPSPEPLTRAASAQPQSLPGAARDTPSLRSTTSRRSSRSAPPHFSSRRIFSLLSAAQLLASFLRPLIDWPHASRRRTPTTSSSFARPLARSLEPPQQTRIHDLDAREGLQQCRPDERHARANNRAHTAATATARAA